MLEVKRCVTGLRTEHTRGVDRGGFRLRTGAWRTAVKLPVTSRTPSVAGLVADKTQPTSPHRMETVRRARVGNCNGRDVSQLGLIISYGTLAAPPPWGFCVVY